MNLLRGTFSRPSIISLHRLEVATNWPSLAVTYYSMNSCDSGNHANRPRIQLFPWLFHKQRRAENIGRPTDSEGMVCLKCLKYAYHSVSRPMQSRNKTNWKRSDMSGPDVPA